MAQVLSEKSLRFCDAELAQPLQDNPLAAVSQGDRIDAQVDVVLQHPRMDRPGRKPGGAIQRGVVMRKILV